MGRSGRKLTVRAGVWKWTCGRSLVLGVLKQGLEGAWDFLWEQANEHNTLHKMLGHDLSNRERYECQNMVDDVSLMTPELLDAVSDLIAQSGHEVAGEQVWHRLAWPG